MESFWDIFYVPLGWLMKLCYTIIPNYGVALILFALIIKLLLCWFSIRQQKNSIKQAKLYPYERAIRRKYNGGKDNKATQQKMQQEIMELQQKEGYNPLSGCLPLLIQFPILIFVYNVIRSPLRYICGLGSEVVAEIKKLAEVSDEISALNAMRADFSKFADNEAIKAGIGELTVNDLPNFNMFGLDMSVTPNKGGFVYLIIPILTFFILYFSSKLTRRFSYQPPKEDQTSEAELSMKIMNLTMPLLSVYISFMTPSVVGVYWMYQNMLGVLQQFILSKVYPIPRFTEEELKEAEKKIRGKNVNSKKKKQKDPNRPLPRSLHHIDDDEYNARVVAEPEKPVDGEKKTVSSFIEPVKVKEYPKENGGKGENIKNIDNIDNG